MFYHGGEATTGKYKFGKDEGIGRGRRVQKPEDEQTKRGETNC